MREVDADRRADLRSGRGLRVSAEKARMRGPSLVRRVVLPGLLRPDLHLIDDDLSTRDLGRIRHNRVELLLA